MAGKTTTRFDVARYMELVRRFPLVPVENERDLDRATAVIDSLLDKERDVEEELYLGALTNLVEKYEDEAYPMEPVDDDAMLEHLLTSRKRSQAELSRGTGIAESTISAVLKGHRRLTRSQITLVAAFFDVTADLFKAGV